MAISNSINSNSTSDHSPFPSVHISMIVSPTRLLVVWVLLFAILLLAACGPEKSGENQDQLLAETKQIALEYQTTGKLDQARTQLSVLKVANPSQWLIYVAETLIAQNNDQKGMVALTHLVLDLDLQSEPISQFASQHNLLKNVAAVPATIAQKSTSNGATLSSAPPPTVAETVTSKQANPITSTTLTPTALITKSTIITQPAAVPLTATTQTTTTQATATQPVSTTLILTPTPIIQTVTKPTVKATSQANVRNGPGTAYTVIGALQPADSAEIIGKNEGGDWWEIASGNGQQGWVFGQLMETSGDMTRVVVAANIPPPPPADTPAPVPPTAAPQAADTPAAPTPVPNGNDFVMVQRHLWDVIENGGQLDGPSVTCGQARELIVNVLDANGNRLNGVAVQVQYGAKEIYVTGAQGKGDGVAEFVLGGGQDVKVIKDVDGRDATSDVATGLSTKPWDIPYETLIEGRFCQDAASCKSFADHTGCYGHYSWTITFKRQH